MALEQLRAFREGKDIHALGEYERIGPDEFPLLALSDLQPEHEKLTRLLRSSSSYDPYGYTSKRLKQTEEVSHVLEGNDADRSHIFLAMLERIVAFELDPPEERRACHDFFWGYVSELLLQKLLRLGVDIDQVAEPALEWFSLYRFRPHAVDALESIVEWVASRYADRELPGSLRDRLIEVRTQFLDMGYEERNTRLIDQVLGDGLWLTLAPVERWAEAAFGDILAQPTERQAEWRTLLEHCGTARSAKPSARWTKTARALLDNLGRQVVRDALVRWFPLVDASRRHPLISNHWMAYDEQQRMHEMNATLLRGLVWLCPEVASGEITRALGTLATAAFRKVPGIGPRSVKVGNACIWALSTIGNEAAVGQLAILRVRLKLASARKQLDKAFAEAARRAGISPDEIEEMGVPTYGLTEVGACHEKLGDYAAELRVDGTTSTTLAWIRHTETGPKRQKSVPAAVKRDYADELKELKAAAKDIQQMLPAHRDRIDAMFLQRRTWPYAAWAERYLNHPLIGTIARRLIWRFDAGDGPVSAMWVEGRFVDAQGVRLSVPEAATVSLWHPIEADQHETLAWRDLLHRYEIRQPFKQAHREIYLLTDAERRTETYSNRFASHLLKQHQFNALCAARGWRNTLRLMVDDLYPPAMRELPAWGLRGEYWVEGMGQEYGTDTTESGTYLYLGTDQVRFYRMDSPTSLSHASGGGYEPRPSIQQTPLPLELEQVPPLVFSEIMRDVDLFVGVASVGNDPTWADGGPRGHRRYFFDYSFGDLGATAKTRREVLKRLVPRLKIADQCELSDRFLVVRGRLRTYHVHLGSGNILMEPNDQYLCIVPSAAMTRHDGKVFLPFEGDRTLAIILSKAFLLAADDKITDRSILSQIRQQRESFDWPG